MGEQNTYPLPGTIPGRGLTLRQADPTELAYYPHIFRPIGATRWSRWEYAKQGVGGVGYEKVLWSYRVPDGKVLVINRWGAGNSTDSNYTLRVQGVSDPVLADVGEKTFAISGGVPGATTLTYKNFAWDVEGYIAAHPIRGSFLMDPIVVDENQLVEFYAKTSAASGEMAGGCAGYSYDKVSAGFGSQSVGT